MPSVSQGTIDNRPKKTIPCKDEEKEWEVTVFQHRNQEWVEPTSEQMTALQLICPFVVLCLNKTLKVLRGFFEHDQYEDIGSINRHKANEAFSNIFKQSIHNPDGRTLVFQQVTELLTNLSGDYSIDVRNLNVIHARGAVEYYYTHGNYPDGFYSSYEPQTVGGAIHYTENDDMIVYKGHILINRNLITDKPLSNTAHTLIHEASHKFCNTVDHGVKGYKLPDMPFYREPELTFLEAINNADSYAWFCIYCTNLLAPEEVESLDANPSDDENEEG